MKILLIILLLICSIASASPESFIEQVGPVAQEILPGYGLWPSVFIAQAALESGWGRSWLAQNANNYFGRKCLADPCIEILTPEYRSGVRVMEPHLFQVYPDFVSAVHGYAGQFFRRYDSGAMVYPELDASTYETQIRSIAPRYATDPRYADKVLQIINEWGITDWDAYSAKRQ